MSSPSIGFKQTGTCPKCGSNQYKRERLTMQGFHGAGLGYDFDVFICDKCKFSELYFIR